ncbi:MAG: dipeptide epimerase [bacterium]|nr:dipeptide epimerase [bacterium]
MKLSYYPYTIKLKDTFSIASGSRNTTPAVMVEVEHNGLVGYGEASLPPYLEENQDSVINFLNNIHLDKYADISNINLLLDFVDNSVTGNSAAKASLDIALYDLWGKLNSLPLYKMLGVQIKKNLFTSFTIGISNAEELERKIESASGYKFLKVKLGSNRDKEIISSIRMYTDKPLFVDVNQGWKDKYFALDMMNWLSEKKVLLVEQPIPKENLEDAKWLLEKSPIPIIADEAVQDISDIEKIKDCYTGINIKLMKAGGIRNADRMIKLARDLKLKVMIGCMTETSCAISAASHLAPLADWIDLDGSELISNDLFSGLKIVSGEIVVPDTPGLGIEKKN